MSQADEALSAALPHEVECERCPGVMRTLRPFYEGSARLAYRCPCCKSALRTGEMIRAESEAYAKERGLSVDEYERELRAMVPLRNFDDEPLSAEEEAAIGAFARQHAQDWNPVCEHDTENPWT